MIIRLATLSVGLFLAACQGGSGSSGRMATKVSEVELTTQTGTTTTIEKTTVGYAGSRIDTIAQFRNGAAAGTAKVTYGAGGIEKIEYADKDGDKATNTLTHTDGRLTKNRFEIVGVTVDEETFAYHAEQKDLIKEITQAHTPTGGTVKNTLVKFEYDGENRNTKRVNIDGTLMSSTEFRYNPDGLLERASSFSGATHLETYNFSYTPEGTLDEVVDTKNNRYEVTYDQNKRIIEIRFIANGTTMTWRYTYAQGTADGWTFAPSVPAFGLIDLGGNSFTNVSMKHGSIEIPSDIPKPIGNPGGVCPGFTPQDACDTCLAGSCCTQTKSCLTGTPCYAFFQCAQPCTTQTCQDSCRQTHVAGAQAYDAFSSCATSFCNTDCAGS